jgi:hypothetical protein
VGRLTTSPGNSRCDVGLRPFAGRWAVSGAWDGGGSVWRHRIGRCSGAIVEPAVAKAWWRTRLGSFSKLDEFDEVVSEHAVSAPGARTVVCAQAGASPRPVAFEV